eukprot:3760634-Rhodomonas_salina.1
MYLCKQERAEWVIERDTATRNGLIQAAWTAQMKTDDQYTAYQLIYVTFLKHCKNILDQVKEGVGDFAMQAWKDIWQSYMIEDAVESADLGNKMRLAKFFEGEFKNYINEIVNLNTKLASLNQAQPESQLVNEILQHMLEWMMNKSDSPDSELVFLRNHVEQDERTLLGVIPPIPGVFRPVQPAAEGGTRLKQGGSDQQREPASSP